MSSKHHPIPWRLHEDEPQSNVPLDGIAGIPDDVAEAITNGLEDHLAPDQYERANLAILRGAREIRDRHMAAMRGRRGRPTVFAIDDED